MAKTLPTQTNYRFNKINENMNKNNWSELNHLQLGKYAEYFVKMEFAQYGFDIYSSDVDDRGIDFVIRREPDHYYDIQVKSVRGGKYIFFPKNKFQLRDNLIAAIVIFLDGKIPQIFLVPSIEWLSPNSLLVSHDFIGKKCKPEWGLNISKKNMALLEKFNFNIQVRNL